LKIEDSVLIVIKMVVGHQKQRQFLKTALTAGKAGHAWIFSGPDKVGKKTAALEWASEILGFSAGEKTAHPDFLFTAPLVDGKTGKSAGEITVAQIRELIAKMALAPAGRCKTAIIDSAHLMNAEAQNCLLKTLEEPPGASLMILIAENDQRLFATVRSRCQIVRFNFLPQSEMEKLAGEIGPRSVGGETKEIAEMSFGRPGRLVDFLKNPEELKKWRVAEKEFAGVISGDLAQKFAYAKKITDEEKEKAKEADARITLNEILEIWQNHFRRLLLEALNDPQRVRPLLKGSDSFKNFGAQKIAGTLKKIQTLDFELRTTNAHPRLAIENFLLNL
jgi:DNA polymerase-3 subunit delta'